MQWKLSKYTKNEKTPFPWPPVPFPILSLRSSTYSHFYPPTSTHTNSGKGKKKILNSRKSQYASSLQRESRFCFGGYTTSEKQSPLQTLFQLGMAREASLANEIGAEQVRSCFSDKNDKTQLVQNVYLCPFLFSARVEAHSYIWAKGQQTLAVILQSRVGKPKRGGVPWWPSGLRTWCCYCCGSGCCFRVGSTPGPGTSACCRYSPKKKRERQRESRKIMPWGGSGGQKLPWSLKFSLRTHSGRPTLTLIVV